jgi:hypothetical protein
VLHDTFIFIFIFYFYFLFFFFIYLCLFFSFYLIRTAWSFGRTDSKPRTAPPPQPRAQVLPAPPLHLVSPWPMHFCVDFFYPVSPAPLSPSLARADISSVILTPRLRRRPHPCRFASGKSDSNARWTHGSKGELVKAPYPASPVPPSAVLARATISSVLTPRRHRSVSHHYQLALASPPCCASGLGR